MKPRKGVAVFDERRNSSRVFPVPPGAFTEAREACRRWAQQNPAHFQWLLDGHPTLTKADHVARFGESYDAALKRTRSPGTALGGAPPRT